MSFWSRYATRAVQRENVRLTKRIADLAADLRKATRDLGAASERNTQHIRNAMQAAENALAVGAAYDKLRAEYDRVVDALTSVTAERDQALADKVALEEKLQVARNAAMNASPIIATFDHEPCEQRNDRDRAEIERLEQELRTLAAEHLEASGRNADLEARLAFSHNQADRAEAQIRDFVTAGQRYDLDDVRDEKRSMDRGEE